MSDSASSDPSKLPDAVCRRLQDLTRRTAGGAPERAALPSSLSSPREIVRRALPGDRLAGLARTGAELSAKRAERRPAVDILFMHDATGSILSVIEELHQMVREVTSILQARCDARFGLLCYRGDCNQADAVEIVPIGGVESFLHRFGNIEHRCSTHWESPIDVGVVRAATLEWASDTKVFIVLGDAQPHACEVHDWLSAAHGLRHRGVSSYVVWWKTIGGQMILQSNADRAWFSSLAEALGGRFFASTDISSSELASFIVGSVLQASGQLEQPESVADLSLKLPGFEKMKRLLLSTPTSSRPALGDGCSSGRRGSSSST